MSGRSRTVVCIKNIEIADFLCAEREKFRSDVKTKLFKTIDNACNSLCDYPTPVTNLYEAKQVKNIGNWILKLLKVFFAGKNTSDPAAQSSSPEPTGRNDEGKKKYCPKKGSAAYALLITLLRAHQSGKEFMKKQELIDATEMSGLSDKSIRPNPISWNGGQPNSRDWYSGWNGMKTLTEKCLAVKTSNPGKYKLTDQGKLLAQECLMKGGLYQENNSGRGLGREDALSPSSPGRKNGESSSGRLEDLSSDEDIQEIRRSEIRQRNNNQFSNQQIGMVVDRHQLPNSLQIVSGNANLQPPTVIGSERAADMDRLDTVCSTQIQGLRPTDMNSAVEDELAVPPLKAGEMFSDVYDITCILDRREQFRRGVGTAPNLLASIATSLQTEFNVNVETRQLPVGDVLWIARHKQQNEEYVLDFVLERKQVDDFWLSIKDNRYKEQKLRLMNCGLKRLLYLVEGDVNKVDFADALKTAMFTTEIQGGFNLLRTTDFPDTKRRYGHLTLAILSRYNMTVGKGRGPGRVCRTYKEFVEHCKDFQKGRVADVFCLQLTQIGQITEDVARSIQDQYPTLLSVVQAYTRLEGNQAAQEKLLQGIPIRNSTKTISGAMSKNIYKVIWTPSYD